MSKPLNSDQLGRAIGEELTRYHAQIVREVNDAGADAMKKLVAKTKQKAPKKSGQYAKAIGSTVATNAITGDKTYTWGAKGNQGNLTHLIAKSHKTGGGGRTRGSDFLRSAVDEVIPEYEANVKGIIERGLFE